jgi:hypothetical protein
MGPAKNAVELKACNEAIGSLTLREARAAFYQRNGFPQDGGACSERWSPLGCRDLKTYLPNFEWRRRALPVHDLHHVITGYEFSPTGEFQMSAWEFAAGRYPNSLSTLFCLPLVCIGTVARPGLTFAAFVRGRRSKTLYAATDLSALLSRSVREVRQEYLPAQAVRAAPRDWGAFLALFTASALLCMAPLLLASALYLLWR